MCEEIWQKQRNKKRKKTTTNSERKGGMIDIVHLLVWTEKKITSTNTKAFKNAIQ